MTIPEIRNSSCLLERMTEINCALKKLEECEFQYALDHLLSCFPEQDNVSAPETGLIEKKIRDRFFYKNIQLKPEKKSRIIIDKNISELTVQLFAGIISGRYRTEWVKSLFYFDIRCFIFFPRTLYFTGEVLSNLRNKPYMQFEKKQKIFEEFQGIGYRDFKEANREIDTNLINLITSIINRTGTPVIIGIAGPTAAGKTEIAEYLQNTISHQGKTVKSVEMDNFFTDRDYREAEGIGSMEKESLHYSLLIECLKQLKEGKACEIPEYNQLTGESSHNTDHTLKKGRKGIKIQPADIIYIEGNFPFLFPEITPLIDLKIIYLTDDDIRLKRKWKRDIDYRKKYDPKYFCNRYFRTQFLKAEKVYIKQLEICDIAADTTNSSIWINDKTGKILAG